MNMFHNGLDLVERCGCGQIKPAGDEKCELCGTKEQLKATTERVKVVEAENEKLRDELGYRGITIKN